MTLITMRSIGLPFFVAALVGICAACTNTRLTDTQVNETIRGESVSYILVIMVTDDDELREPFEDGFVAQFNKRGVKAVSSLDVFAVPGDQKLKKEVILKTVDEYQNDAVLISHLVDVEKSEISTYSDESSTADYGGFYGYYKYAYDYVHAPGLFSTHTHKFVRLETNLYGVEVEKLMWSGRAESRLRHPKSDKRVIDDMIKVVIKDLQRNNLIPSK